MKKETINIKENKESAYLGFYQIKAVFLTLIVTLANQSPGVRIHVKLIICKETLGQLNFLQGGFAKDSLLGSILKNVLV